MDLKTAKLMGGVGAILTLLSFVPGIGWLLSIAGFILILLAVKTISNEVKESKIFSDYLIAVVLSVVGVLVLFFGGIASIFGMIFEIARMSMQGATSTGLPSAVFGVSRIILLFLAAWGILIIGSYFTKSSFYKISEKTGEKNFKTAGLLIFLGTILVIAFGTGTIVSLVGVIFEIIAFFSLPDKLAEPELPQT
jgi:uncharacterized membrane protein